MGDISANFSRWEFVDRRTGELEGDLTHLVEHLEELRHICGDTPLQILSGYRSAETNRRVGGAANSQHLYARAADIPAGYCNAGQARQAGFTGIGIAGKWAVHVDVRPDGPAVWYY